MCGRTACTLDPDVICRASSYKDPSETSTKKYKKPKWREHPPSKDPGTSYQYYPSVNISPTKFVPVMINGNKLVPDSASGEATEYEIMPMMFGLIPHYHNGEAKSHGLSTNNCRLENLLESKLYKRSWNQRKFCVILTQGFYEWKTVGSGSKGKKQPYLIYEPQDVSSEDKKYVVVDNSAWENGEWNEESGWTGPKLLKMAGLFDVWKSPKGDEVYSFTIITMESNETLSWLHHRMPAIFDDDEQVHLWLNATPETDPNQLLGILKPVKRLQWHPVDTKVGNSRCHDQDCMQPVEETKKKVNTFMDKWLKKGTPTKKVKSEENPEDESPAKKSKSE